MDKKAESEAKASIRSVIIATNHIMNIIELEKLYKQYMGTPLPYHKFGFESAEQFLRQMPDVVTVKGHGPGALVRHVPSQKSNHIVELVKNQKTENRRRPRRKPRQRAIYSSPFYAINNSVSDDTDEDSEAFKKLNISGPKVGPHSNENQEISFSSLDESEGCPTKRQVHDASNETNEMIPTPTIDAATAEDSPQEREPIDHPGKVSPREEAINKRFESVFSSRRDSDSYDPTDILNDINTVESHPVHTGTRNNILFGLRTYPTAARKQQKEAIMKESVIQNIENIGVVKPIMKKIPKCNLYDDIKRDSIIAIYVCEIRSAVEFFFHIDKENHELIKLQTYMRKYYSNNDHNMTDSDAVPGRYCAVQEDDTWYRAKILDAPSYLNSFSKIKLLFIDHGCERNISVKQLKFLAPILYRFPVQAARAYLSGIKSNDRAHSYETKMYFESLVFGRGIYACVKNIDKQPSSFELVLLDTSKQPKCNINLALIKKGLIDTE